LNTLMAIAEWKNIWQLPSWSSLVNILSSVYNEEAALKGWNGDWFESNPNVTPVLSQTITWPEYKCTQLWGTGPYYKVNYYLQLNPATNWKKDDQADIAGISWKVSFQQYITKSERNAFSQIQENKYGEWAQPAETPVKAYTDSNCTTLK
jgi:hypothetical protein